MNTIIFPILSGTNAQASYRVRMLPSHDLCTVHSMCCTKSGLQTFQAFEGTYYGIKEVAIPPMQVPHIRTILNSLKDSDDNGLAADEVLDDFISFVNFAIGGHPRLLRAFVSVLSEAGYLLLQREKRRRGPDGEKKGENEAEAQGGKGDHEEGKDTEVAGPDVEEEIGEEGVDIEEELDRDTRGEQGMDKGEQSMSLEEEELGKQGRDTTEEVEGHARARGEDEEGQGVSQEGPQERSEHSNLAQEIKLPTLRRAFTESDKEELGPTFYLEGYDTFFDRHLYADINRRWTLIKDTWTKVQLKQFPEVSAGILQSDGMIHLLQHKSTNNTLCFNTGGVWRVVKETVLILLLSDSEVSVGRADRIIPPHHGGKLVHSSPSPRLPYITWGELESHGGVILDPLPNQDAATANTWKVRYYTVLSSASILLIPFLNFTKKLTHLWVVQNACTVGACLEFLAGRDEHPKGASVKTGREPDLRGQ